MRICLFSTTYAPRVGGYETHIRGLAEGLASVGQDVTVFTNRDSYDHAEFEVMEGVKVVRSGQYLSKFDPSIQVPWEEGLFRVLKDFELLLGQGDFDIIHAQNQASVLIASMSLFGSRTPLVASYHETEPHLDPCGVSKARFIVGLCPVTKVIVGSKFFYDQAVEHGVPKSKLCLVYHGLKFFNPFHDPLTAHHRLCEELNISADKQIILLVGRFKARKGQLELLSAVQNMRQRTKVHVVLVGSCSGASRSYLEAVINLCEESGLSNQVTILEDASDQLRTISQAGATVVVQPSKAEGLCLSVIESMGHSKPVVASLCAGISEYLVHGINGYACDTDNPHEFARALDSALDNQVAREIVGAAAAAFVREAFSVERMVFETLHIYRECIARAQG